MNLPNSRLRATRAEIDISALRRNLQKLRSQVNENLFFCPMVKADAYGHGAVKLAQVMAAEGVERFGVSLVEEAVELRLAGIKKELLVFGTFNDLDSAKTCKKFLITPVVSSWKQLNVLEQVYSADKLHLHLKFDTGMNRLGFSLTDATKLRSRLANFANWQTDGICTHLSRGEDSKSPSGFTAQQFAKFDEILKAFDGLKFLAHALNSSGLLSTELAKYGARPGIALYGGCEGFESVMTLKSEIVSLREVEAESAVSYNATWIAKRKSVIGIVPVGYADGIPRLLSNSFSVLCRGERVPAVGTVCMDYVMLDLTDLSSKLSGLGVGEEVVFFGHQGRAEIRALEWAKILGTISYEIFTGISSRVPREYVST